MIRSPLTAATVLVAACMVACLPPAEPQSMPAPNYSAEQWDCFQRNELTADKQLAACSLQARGVCPKAQRRIIEEEHVTANLGCLTNPKGGE